MAEIPNGAPTHIPAAHEPNPPRAVTAPLFGAALSTADSSSPSKSTNTEELGMFGPELISPEIAASLPPTYTIRALRKSDYGIGFLDVLRVLTTVGDIKEEEWNERYDWMNGQGKGGYYLLVIEDQGRIVGTGALLVERKLY
jgi:glucosamine-phosphate N-acetyltransferase